MKVISESVYLNPFNCLKVRVNFASLSASCFPGSTSSVVPSSEQAITVTVKPELRVRVVTSILVNSYVPSAEGASKRQTATLDSANILVSALEEILDSTSSSVAWSDIKESVSDEPSAVH